jgi:hypothetical protein
VTAPEARSELEVLLELQATALALAKACAGVDSVAFGKALQCANALGHAALAKAKEAEQ